MVASGVEGANRRLLLKTAVLAGVASATGSAAAQTARQPEGWRLTFRPRVLKIIDLPREQTEAWIVMAVVEAPVDVQVRINGLEVSYFAGESLVKTERHTGASAEAMALRGAPPRGDVYRPLGLRLLCRERASLAIDRMRCVVSLEGIGDVSGETAITTYAQRTELIFPFRGPGIVTQGNFANGGHRNASGGFAIDAMALAENYAPQRAAAFAVNTDLAGYGHPLIAPAAGIIVTARGDRPDQPVPGESNPDFHVPELRGAGDPGNHIVIDHGNGEFSLVAHMMAGSLVVAEGQRAERGQQIGRLGNSGDSFAPHVHYHLQEGANIQTSTGLPCRFSNVNRDRFDRGEFFLAT